MGSALRADASGVDLLGAEWQTAVSEHLSPSCHQGVCPRNVALVCHLKVSVSFSPLKTVHQALNILSQAMLAAFYAGITVLFLSKAVAQLAVWNLGFNFILTKKTSNASRPITNKTRKNLNWLFWSYFSSYRREGKCIRRMALLHLLCVSKQEKNPCNPKHTNTSMVEQYFPQLCFCQVLFLLEAVE